MKAKLFFTVFIGMAIVPLVLAYAALNMGWYTPGATAKGQFVDHDIQLDMGANSKAGIWRIVAQPESNCSIHCEELLYGLNQTYVALGKLQKRVEARVLNEQLDLTKYPKLISASSAQNKLTSQFLYLVDPFGKVILQYPVNTDRQQTITTSKAVLSDIKKLLKYSRVG